MKNKKLFLLFPLLAILFSCTAAPNNSEKKPNEPDSEEKDDEPIIPSEDPIIPSGDPITPSGDPSEGEGGGTTYDDYNPMLEPYAYKQYYLHHIGNIFKAWKTYRGNNITVAVIDIGFNAYHEDFYFEDGTHKVSPLSASFITSGNETSIDVGIDKISAGEESHGTFCAGVVGAAINKKGVVGIAPNCNLLLLKTDLKPKSIAKAFKYAADNGAKVVTISIGSYYNYGGDLIDDGSDLGIVFNEPVKYCYDKGVAVISAGGNGGLDKMPTEYTFPGCVDNVIGVGGLAFNSSNEIWTGSSYNSSSKYQSIDVFAPSENMFGCCNYGNKKYDEGWEGTSFASPIVAGLAALYFEKYPQNSAKDFENDLFNTSIKLTKSAIATADQLGYGRVDASRLLNIENDEKVNIKIKASSPSINLYLWNSLTDKNNNPWPGINYKLNNSSVDFEIDTKYYDSIIFNYGTDKTIDLNANSFIYADEYNLVSLLKEKNMMVGKYI